MDRVIHNNLAIRSYRLQLFDPASETAADTGSKNNKRCFLHDNFTSCKMLILLSFSRFRVFRRKLAGLIICDQTVNDFIQIAV